MAQTVIFLLAGLRMAVGSCSLLAPSPTLSLFRMSNDVGAMAPTRLFGVRDAVLGALLWTADTPDAQRRALIAGAVVDGIDALGTAYGAWNGDLSFLAADLVGGGAVVFLAMGLYSLKAQGNVGVGKI